TYNYYGRVARIEDLISVEDFAAFLAGPGPRFVATDDKEIRRHRLTDVPGAYLVEEGPDSRASRRLFANAEGRDLYRRLYGPTGDLAERAPAPATSR
ncbi:MAG: hypothetical protein KC466_00875, partial [Myxococcales bacterium]|nr:hypothetical protein [Myxococcales bacterium]